MAGTIAFSGLSGIDTSSWIDALVSVKQTTLTSLQSQQALKKTLLSTVNSIKSFFTSFQNALQKVTDAQFGISSMDLFMQNLAKSSNTNIVTATATTDAARQSYDVLVSQLATSTKATSGYTQTVTKDATLDTTLGTLGMSAGTVTVNNQSFSVSKDDTLSTLITKFKNVGVTANLDTNTSKFTVSTNVSGINDGTTGLKTALKLSDTPISGVTSGTLVYADTSTALSKLGLTGGAVTMNAAGGATSNYTITKNANNYSIQKGAGPTTTITTLGDLFNYMTGTVGAESATIDSKGNISIQGAVITPVNGGSNLLSALNLTQVVDRTVMKSGALQVTNTHIADSSTTLAQLGITGTQTLTINGFSQPNITSDKTIGDLETILNGAGVGITMSIDSSGVISINTNGATLGGTILTSLGLNPTTEGTTIQSGAHTITNYANGSTLLSSLGVTNAMTYTAYKSDGTALTGSLNNNGGLTVDDFITKLKSNGLDASFDSTTGKITINDGYITGTAATQLGMAVTNTSQTIIAKGSTTLSQLGATTDTNSLIINGTSTNYAKATSLTTIMSAITSAGGAATLASDGTLKITGVTLGGTVPTLLGLSTTQQGTSITSGNLTYVTNTSSTSSAGLNQTVSTNITAATQLGYINSSMTDYTLSINGTNKTYNASTALSTVASDIAAAGGTLKINDDSTITVSGVNLSGGLVGKLDLGATSQGTVLSSNSAIGVGGLTYTADSNTTLSQLGASSGAALSINGTNHSYGASTTLSTIFSDITSAGGTASVDSNGVITAKGVTLTGTAVTALGLTATGQGTSISSGALTYVSATTSTGGTKNSTAVSTANTSSLLSSIVGTSGTNYSLTMVSASGSTTTKTYLDTSTTLSTIFTDIAAKGGSASIDSNGNISVSGVNLSGSLSTALGLTATGQQGTNATGTTALTAGTTLASAGVLRVITNESNVVDLNYTAGTAISSVVSDLNALGITASVSSGRLVAYSADKTFTLSGAVGSYIMGSGGSANSDTGYSASGKTSTTVTTANTSSILGNLGVTSGEIQIKNSLGNITGSIGVSDTMTVAQLQSSLSNYGFTMSVASGKFTISSASGNTLVDGTSNLTSTLGTTTWSNTNSAVSNTTKMSQLGYTSGTTMSLLVDGSSLYQLSFGANDSVQDVENTLATFGVNANVSGGVFNASSSSHTFTLTGDLAKTLTNGTTGYVNSNKGYTSSARTYTTPTGNLSTSSSIADLLGSNTGGILRLAINGSQIVSLTYGATDKVSDVIKDLSDLGITASVSGTGVFSAKSTSETFVLSGEVGQALRGASGTTTNIDEGYNSGTLQEVHTSTATNSSVLKDLGIKSGQIYVMDSNNNVVNSIDISDDMTVQQVKATLLSNGFSMGIDGTGKVTVSSTNGYTLTDGSSDMVSKMNLATWTNTTAKVTTGTTLAQLGFKDGSNLNILIDGANSNSLSFGASDTVQSVINSLGALGITASVDANGKFSASSTGHTFVMSGDLAATLTKGTTGYVNSDKGYTANVTYQGPYATDTSSQLKYTNALSMSTTVASMGFPDGGTIRLVEDGDTPYTLSFLATDTLQDVSDTLAAYGINVSVDSNGKFKATSTTHSFTMGSALGTYLTNGGTYVDNATGYKSSPETYNTTDNIKTTTTLSSLGVANGYLNIMKDGSVVSNNIQIDDTTTVGQLFSAMSVYGLTGQVLTDVNGKSYMKITSADGSYLADGTSNVVSKLGLNNINMGDYTGNLEYWDSSASSGLITNDMLLSSFDKNGYISTGSLLFTTGSGDTAQNHIVNIASDDTVGTFLTKMQNAGVNAVLDNGVIKISNSVSGVTFTGGTSGVMNTLGLTSGNLYTYASSSSAVTYQGKDSSSVANYADGSTLLSTVNTTDGTLSLYVDGVKCSVNVNSSDSFSALFGKIASSVAAKTGLTIKAGFLDTSGNIVTNPAAAQNTGVIAMQIADGHTLVVGASNDTSNFSTIANLSQDSTTEVKGTRALYKVNTSSTLTSSGLFKAGNITAGTFSIGDASFTIDANTTLSSLMTQINKSDKSYASAYWDTLSGTMVIQSTITGASLINIEAGTSNFTDIMGLTKNDSGTETLNTDSQTLGNNAIVEINGTKVISTSNTITSDISKVKGLTLNLKGLSTGTTPTTVTVSQDTDSIVSAVSDIVDSYNDMMDELDKALGTSSSSSSSSTTTATTTTSTGLETDTMLKMLKNSLKSMMTSSVAGLTTYKNLAAVGISTGDASDSISTDVTSLVFDKEKFLSALNANPDDVKKLLVGTSSSQGILLQEYNKVQSTLKSTGYISTLTNSTNKAISTLDTKISNMSDALTKYREQLEKKFNSMDTIISKMQNSYSSLLGTSSSSSGLSSS